jgi:hypothetical protein
VSAAAHPVVLGAPLVRAALAGKEIQIRKPIREFWGIDLPDRPVFHGMRGAIGVFGDSIPDDPCPVELRCPYGAVGGHLWVREGFERSSYHGNRSFFAPGYVYRATFPPTLDERHDAGLLVKPERWRSPVTMPREASRLTLEVVSLRAGRLQDITEEEAQAAGVRTHEASVVFDGGGHISRKLSNTYVGAFACSWDRQYARRAPWTTNPWVWIVSARPTQRFPAPLP